MLGELRDEGHAVLVSTHDIEQAETFDLVLCLNRDAGRLRPARGGPHRRTSLQATYGGELIVLPGGEQAVVVQHHHH